MKAQHTPGPWFLLTFDDGSMAIQPAVGFMIMPLKPRAGFKCDIPNFKLAAAAPDLLAALIDVMSDPYFARAATRYGHARAAIAKAQGGAL